MIKPLVAAGTKESHFMTIILKWSALSKLQPGSIIQEYINHNASLYKVYVLGKNVFVYERTSLPNLPPTDQMDIAIDSLEFDSQRPYPRLNDFGISDDISDLESAVGQDCQSHHPCDATHVSVTVDEILPVVDTLRHAFGLELFGFDILLSQDYKEFHVVDVNYFPSYKEVPNFPMLLAQYLTQRVLEQRRVRRLRISSKS
jgi:inositol-1,3,4-trisphosphate 5/6-kinase/inositol-tetrakisphosphate 1-kinase